MPIYLDSPEPAQQRDLFADLVDAITPRRGRNRQQIVWCERCDNLDSVFLGGGKSLSSVRCRTCGGELTTHRSKSAKLKYYDAIMLRNQALTLAAAHADGDIGKAVDYAVYAAHAAFSMHLARYGPEPPRT